jgi:hypothetical protein
MIGMDKYGNRYFENLEEELPRKLNMCHTCQLDIDRSQSEPAG